MKNSKLRLGMGRLSTDSYSSLKRLFTASLKLTRPALVPSLFSNTMSFM